MYDFICVHSDINDLHKFVSVALHTSAGEGDLANDKLSNLKIVGSGFAPLIYGFKKIRTVDSFNVSCVNVWQSLRQNPKLPKLLVSVDFYIANIALV